MIEREDDLPNAEEQRQAVGQMLQSLGWIVAANALWERRREAREMLETNPRITIEEVRALQAQIALLTELIETPREVFKV